MKKQSIIILALVLALVLSCLAGCSNSSAPESTAPESAAPSAGFVPEEDIEMVVGGSAGASADLFARKACEIITKNGWCPVNFNVINLPGSGYVKGFTYMIEQADSYTLAVTSSSFYTQPIAGLSPLTFDDFKYVSLLAQDPNGLVASSNTGFKSLDDIIAYAKDHPGDIMCGGSNAISDDAILTNQINNQCDVDITYVTIESSTDAVSEVMGGHIQLCWGSPAEIGDNIIAGNVVAIAVASDNRVDYPGMEELPTFKELGYEINHQQPRGFVASKYASDEAVAYYSDLFMKVSETDEWKDYVKTNCMQDLIKDSAGYTDYMSHLIEVYTSNIKELQAKG